VSVYRGKRQKTYRYKFRYRGHLYRGNTQAADRAEAKRTEDAIRLELRLERGGLVPHRLLKGVTPAVLEIKDGRAFVIDKHAIEANLEMARRLLDAVETIANRAHVSEKRGGVYFIGDDDNGPVKIGFATAPLERLRSIQTSNPRRLSLLATVPGTPAGERHLQTFFAALQLAGEWFRRDARLCALIDALKQRVDALEDKRRLAPGEACPKCGAWALRVVQSTPMPHVGMLGARIHQARCEQCGFTDERGVTPTR